MFAFAYQVESVHLFVTVLLTSHAHLVKSRPVLEPLLVHRHTCRLGEKISGASLSERTADSKTVISHSDLEMEAGYTGCVADLARVKSKR